jgi:beta-xylosidase
MKSLCYLAACIVALSVSAQTWTADNGNGTFTNPLFYDEFSDPDLIRVRDDFYLTGTTMHTMPGLPILHSKDLVNWELLGYAFDKLDLGPRFRLEDGKEIYGQGIWAPCFRYHNGTYYIFSNVNGEKTQMFRATNPAGPWTRTEMKRSFHDLSVLFDDDGKVYVIWGYQGIHLVQLNDDLTDAMPGTERVIIERSAGMGEGVHFYKINGKYYILSAWFVGRMRMPCAGADKPEGPYEVNLAISTDEDFGLAEGYRLRNRSYPFDVIPPNTVDGGRMSMHQGGIVQTPTGEWWGFSMMDFNSVGRLTCLSPITWTNGWPYFGLPGNLKRTPRTWVKPNTGHTSPPSVPYQRNDDFSGPKLANVWQWNHVPVDAKWSLSERPGYLRLHSLPATDFWWARNTLTQRSIGPESIPTAELDASGMKPGDVAGLALLNLPYAWIGVRCEANGLTIEQFNQLTGETNSVPLETNRVSLRAHCDFLTEKATLSYSTDGEKFTLLGKEFTMIFQLKTFQGVRYSLFHYNTGGAPGGHADFDRFTVQEPHPRGLMRPIPFGQTITLTPVGGGTALAVGSESRFRVMHRGLGRVALQAESGFISVTSSEGRGEVGLKKGEPGNAETFQWTENVYGDLTLLSLATHRHLRLEPGSGAVFADSPGPKPNRKDGSCFVWRSEVQ